MFKQEKSILKLSLYSFLISLFVFFCNYLVFHYVTDDGIVKEHMDEAGKPFLCNLIGQLAVLFLFLGVVSFLVYEIKRKES